MKHRWVFYFSLVVGLLSIVSIILFRGGASTGSTLPPDLEISVKAAEKAAEEYRPLLEAKNKRFYELKKLVESGAPSEAVAAALDSFTYAMWTADRKWLEFVHYDNDCTRLYFSLLASKSLNASQAGTYETRMEKLYPVRKPTHPPGYFEVLAQANAIVNSAPHPPPQIPAQSRSTRITI